MSGATHWNTVYSTKSSNAVSWFQEHAGLSLSMIRATGATADTPIIDVGGGASTLVDDLLAAGFNNVTVLDWSGAALEVTQRRLGSKASAVRWLVADITTAALDEHAYDVWHDRAVFHFLTAADNRAAYVRAAQRAVRPGGHVIVATFAEEGPTRCSGLPVVRYSAAKLHAEFGAQFSLLRHENEIHHTPSGTTQQFVYCCMRKLAAGQHQ